MKFLIIKIIKYLFVPFGMIYEAFFGERNEIIIIMYHRVNDEVDKEISVKTRNFEWQMNYLKRKNYNVISMDKALELIKSKKIIGKYVVLTFDDGYEDFYFKAYPILRNYKFPSIVYIVPGFIETNNIFWWDKDIGKSALMNWRQISELYKDKLIDFGSHTMNHHDLDKLGDEETQNEMNYSKKILEEKLSKDVKHFAYPRGIYSNYADSIGTEIFQTGVLIFDGKKISNEDMSNSLMKLKRTPVQRSDGKYLFIARLKGYLILEEFIKKIISKY